MIHPCKKLMGWAQILMNKDTGVKGTEEGVQRALMNKDSIIEKGLFSKHMLIIVSRNFAYSNDYLDSYCYWYPVPRSVSRVPFNWKCRFICGHDRANGAWSVWVYCTNIFCHLSLPQTPPACSLPSHHTNLPAL
jgi:hypothetical protein